MIEILFIIGSPRSKGFGCQLSSQLKEIIEKKMPDIKINELYLSNLNYCNCQGCLQCFINGECSLSMKDGYDFDQKLENNHGFVIFIPTYIHQMPGKLKNCFDRMAYKIHQFPLIGKKTIIVTYTATNGVDELLTYSKKILLAYGVEIVDSFKLYESNIHIASVKKQIYHSIVEMLNRIKNNNYQVTKSQETLFRNLKHVVETEIEQKIVTYKQERWHELIKYSSLIDYIKTSFISEEN